jgi:hypothetical protein
MFETQKCQNYEVFFINDFEFLEQLFLLAKHLILWLFAVLVCFVSVIRDFPLVYVFIAGIILFICEKGSKTNSS